MLTASLRLNKAMGEFLELSRVLGQEKGVKTCDISDEGRAQAGVKFLKTYELCIRADEALADIMRHRDEGAIEGSLAYAEEMMTEITRVVTAYSDKERRILRTYLSRDFSDAGQRLIDLTTKRPADRIWRKDNIEYVAGDLMKALWELRKSAAYALFMVVSGNGNKALGELKC